RARQTHSRPAIDARAHHGDAVGRKLKSARNRSREDDMQRRTALRLIACARRSSTSAQAAHAQDFSGKPIRLLVGLAAGGATDVMARLVAQKMSENLRTSFCVKNRVGGIFIRALGELPGSPADGHPLFFISTSTLITQPLHPDYPFD